MNIWYKTFCVFTFSMLVVSSPIKAEDLQAKYLQAKQVHLSNTLVSQTTVTHTLKDLQWQNRIVVVSAKVRLSAASIQDQLQQNAQGVKARKLLFLRIQNNTVLDALSGKNNGINTQELARRLKQKDIILIGLDGQTKAFYEAHDALPLKQIFADIDGMPMRQWELN